MPCWLHCYQSDHSEHIPELCWSGQQEPNCFILYRSVKLCTPMPRYSNACTASTVECPTFDIIWKSPLAGRCLVGSRLDEKYIFVQKHISSFLCVFQSWMRNKTWFCEMTNVSKVSIQEISGKDSPVIVRFFLNETDLRSRLWWEPNPWPLKICGLLGMIRLCQSCQIRYVNGCSSL